MRSLGFLKVLKMDNLRWPAMPTTEDPVTRLAAFVKDAAQAEVLAKDWKMSTAETKQLMWLVNVRNDAFTSHAAKVFITDGINQQWVTEWANMNRNGGMAKWLGEWKAPTFPVTGDDMIAAGVKPGKEMGDRLRSMKKSWQDSLFTMSKNDLMKGA